MNFYTNVAESYNKMLVRGVRNGRRYMEKVDYKPTFYVPSQTPTEHKALYGGYLKPIKQNSISEARDFLREHADVSGMEIHGMTKFPYQYIAETWQGEVKYDPDLIKVYDIDIEVYSPNGFPNPEQANAMVSAITVKNRQTNQYTVFGVKPYEVQSDNVKFFQTTQETDLLENFLTFWTADHPDIVTGWNIDGFDIPYLVNRIARLMGDDAAKELSPWKTIKERTVRAKFGREHTAYDLVGITSYDALELYKKYTYTKQETYKLDHIAYVELGERKLSYEEAGSLVRLFETDYQKYIDYNIRDVELVSRIEEKMQFVPLALTQAYMAKCNLADVFGTVNIWEVMIYNRLLENGIQPPPRRHGHKDTQYAGAFVKEPIPGMYKWVVSLDLNSLYPSIARQYNISPETIIPHTKVNTGLQIESSGLTMQRMIEGDFGGLTGMLVAENVCMTANHCFYTKEYQGFLPAIFADLYEQRVVAKKEMIGVKKALEGDDLSPSDRKVLENKKSMLHNRQMALKIALNSAYGALGNAHFLYYNTFNAEAITVTGQLVIQWIEHRLNLWLNKILKTDGIDYVVAIDTDSNYIVLDRLVQAVMPNETDPNKIVNFIDRLCQKEIEPYITKCYEDLAEKTNAYEQLMFMKREAIADVAVWTGKKRYIMNVWDLEGVRFKEPVVKVTGLEAVRSSTPEVCRKKLKELYGVMVTKTEPEAQAFMDKFRKDWNNLAPHEIAFPRNVNGLSKYGLNGGYIKGTPAHVKAALTYNRMVKEKRLEATCQFIEEGDSMKFVHLCEPNPAREKMVSFVDFMPPELGLDKYVDYKTQFEKAFLEPVRRLFDVVGWNVEHVASVEDFFE